MHTSEKIDALLGILGRLADAPPAASASAYELEIRRALGDLPDVSKAGGADVADDGPVRLKRRENATAGGIATVGESATRWWFRGFDDYTRTTGGSPELAGAGHLGGARRHLDTPAFVDTIGGAPVECPALSCSLVPRVCCPDGWQFVWQGGLSIHEGGLISCPVNACAPGFCPTGCSQWY